MMQRDERLDEDLEEIERLLLPGAHRVAQGHPSKSLPDAALNATSLSLASASRSFPKMSGSVQTQFLPQKPHASRHHGAHPTHSNETLLRRPHREHLTRTETDARIFGDNRQAQRFQHRAAAMQFDMWGLHPVPLDEEGHDYVIRIPYFEPVLYLGWMVPLNWFTYKIMRQIPVVLEEDLVQEILFSLTSSCFIVSLFLKPLPAVHLIEFFRQHSLTTMFYNHHLAAFEGLIVSRVTDVVLAYQKVSAEVRLGTFFGTFFLTFVGRHLFRIRRTQSLTLHMGEFFMMIMVY